MRETLTEKKQKIARFILDLEKSFKISELYKMLEENNISKDKEIILDVLDELYQNGLVDGKELEDSSWGYKSNWGKITLETTLLKRKWR